MDCSCRWICFSMFLCFPNYLQPPKERYCQLRMQITALPFDKAINRNVFRCLKAWQKWTNVTKQSIRESFSISIFFLSTSCQPPVIVIRSQITGGCRGKASVNKRSYQLINHLADRKWRKAKLYWRPTEMEMEIKQEKRYNSSGSKLALTCKEEKVINRVTRNLFMVFWIFFKYIFGDPVHQHTKSQSN